MLVANNTKEYQMGYNNDIREAARSDARFDQANAWDIGDYYGEDQVRVMKEIARIREEMNY